MSLSRKIFGLFGLVMLILAAFLVFATIAVASNRSWDMTVVPQTQFVQQGQNAIIDYTATNNTNSSATCDFQVSDLYGWSFDAPIGTIGAGQTAGGELSTPALYKNDRFTFNLMCDGALVGTRTVNVKVR